MAGNDSSSSVGEAVCVRASVSPTQPTAGPGGHERLLVDIAADGALAGDLADRRDRGEPLADRLLDLGRHQIAAVRIGADRHRLHLERAQAGALAGAHVGIEGRLVLERRGAARRLAFAAERRTRALERDVVEPARLRVDGVVDAGELLLDHDVAGALVGERQALVVGLLEGLEGAHHLGMRHHRVERNARLGLEIIVGVDIH